MTKTARQEGSKDYNPFQRESTKAATLIRGNAEGAALMLTVDGGASRPTSSYLVVWFVVGPGDFSDGTRQQVITTRDI